MVAKTKLRLDLLLVERGLVPSRERARALILAGRVLVREQKIEKPGTTVPEDASVRLLGEDPPYVSRGGVKLAAALAHWPIVVQGRACLDVGASTGGFTDCLLQHGAVAVTAVDTGFGQIAMKLRNDPRVHLLERTNARLLKPNELTRSAAESLTGPITEKLVSSCEEKHISTCKEKHISTCKEKHISTCKEKHISTCEEKHISTCKKRQGTTLVVPQMQQNECGALAPEVTPDLSLLVMDVAFISATLLLEPVLAAAPGLVEAVILVKPQFEAGREHVGKGGIVRDPEAHQLAIDKVANSVRSLGWEVVETIPSPITGMEGNREFLLYARRP